MPKVISHTPPWLSRPSPGARIFSDPEPQSPTSPSKRSSYFSTTNALPPVTGGPRRLIASRGSEIFTVVGNKIRWADLSRVRNGWEDRSREQTANDDKEAYRTLVTPVYYEILQLLISPSGHFLAICTEHTVHVAVLPDSSRLAEHDRSPLKLKTYQVGPTTHVIPESPLASVIWHPLAASSVSTDCLITVTAEAALRTWEIDRASNWSFERPALAIDLRKLADGVSCDQDFEPSGFGKSRGFSVDAFDMEASGACFGGQGLPDEDGWASMTLWIAMANGDVYALCPFLPSEWKTTSTTVASLSVSAVANISTLAASAGDDEERKAAEQQYEWVQEIDNQESAKSDAKSNEFRIRPSVPSAFPRLQGPFEIEEVDGIGGAEISDIHVIAARLDEDSLLSGEDDYDVVSDGFQFTTICLSTTTGQVYISLELEGVSGQWLPKRDRATFSVPTSDSRSLTLVEKHKIADGSSPSSLSWLMLTPNPDEAYSFYATSGDKIFSLSLTDWAARIGIETNGENEGDSGLHTRLGVACQDTICVVQEVLKAETSSSAPPIALFSAPTYIQNVALGDMLISCFANQAYAVSFEQHSFSQSMQSLGVANTASPFRSSLALIKMLEEDVPDPFPTRAPYAPSEYLYQNQMSPYEELKQRVPTARRSILSDKPLRLSPACLDIMTLAHRTFSRQTSHIEKAAAELFRRCERLRGELADQVKQMSELADRLQNIRSTSHPIAGEGSTFDERLNTAKDRQKRLVQRYEALRRKSGRIGTANAELSSKEQVWIAEIDTLAQTTGVDVDDRETSQSIVDRYETVQTIAKDLIEQTKHISESSSLIQKDVSREDSPTVRSSTQSVSSKLQRERIAEVMQMIEREEAIIDAVTSRLSKLSTDRVLAT